MPQLVVTCTFALLVVLASSQYLSARDATPSDEPARQSYHDMIAAPRIDDVTVKNHVNKVVIALLLAMAPAQVPAAAFEAAAAETSVVEETVAAPVDEETATLGVPGHFVLQSENSAMASDLIGAMVYSRELEVVGEVTDVVISLDGQVDGVIIGVGGFLGLGEKRIAVKLQSLEVLPDLNGRVKVVISASREAVEQAPDFKSQSQQRFELEVEREMRELEEQRAAPPETEQQ